MKQRWLPWRLWKRARKSNDSGRTPYSLPETTINTPGRFNAQSLKLGEPKCEIRNFLWRS
jgi:hypothetical protein